MKSKDLANHILTTGESGYKTRLEGEEISDRMTKLIDQHVQEQLNLLRVSKCSQCGLEKENLICHACAIENYGMGA